MKLAPDFTSHEMSRSTGHPDLATAWAEIESDAVANLTRVVVEFLQPVREFAGRIRVLSGFRSPELNEAVEGAMRSRHLRGLAADFLPVDLEPLALWRALVQGDVLGARWDRLTIYTTLDPMTFHVDLREWEQGEQRGRLYRGAPWQRLTSGEALELAA